MERTLLELTSLEEALRGYDIYKDCMYLPSEEKFRRKMTGYLADGAVKVFACLDEGQWQGMAVLQLLDNIGDKAELLGIATAPHARGKGIGTFMVSQLMARCQLQELAAETDDDAVGFYRKAGFAVEPFAETYDGETVTRYRCVWKERGRG